MSLPQTPSLRTQQHQQQKKAVDTLSEILPLIRLYVPSADTAYVDGAAVPNSPAGTGPFRVVTNEGISIPGGDELTISFSVASDATSMPKNPALLAPREVFQSRFIFHIDSAVAHYQDGAMVPVIKKALREWSCLTGIDWAVADDTVYQSLPGAQADSTCVITFGELSSAPEYFQLALTSRYMVTCGEGYYGAETDLTISNDPGIVWFIDTVPTNPIPADQHDLYHTLLHELGHAHNLKHVLAPEQIMYFADNTYEGFRKIELFSDASAYEGGNWAMDASYSSPPAVGSCNLSAISITTAPLCAGYYSINEQPTPAQFLLQPNPFIGTLHVSSLDKRICAIEVFNALGASVDRRVQLASPDVEIDLSALGSGVYMIKALLDNGVTVTLRAIKAH